MKKVLFFTQNRWAFGSIHHALCKELYKHNIYANLLDWTVQYSKDEFKHLQNTYDIFVTNPDAVLPLHYNYDVPLNKIITIAHGQWDILLAKQNADQDFYPHLKGFAVISNVLKRKCIEWSISVIPKVVEVGIHFDMFYDSPSSSLRYIGYGGAKKTTNFFGVEIKRGELIEQVVDCIDNVELVPHSFYNHLCMPGYYKNLDCVVMGSIEEAGGLPMLESAAAGRLPIGTPVGYFEENSQRGGGILLPLEETSFKEQLKNTLEFYRDNPIDYKNKCLEVQAYARDNYDWSKKIDKWLDLFSL
jgi:glycosyltransferase involved in cell wall biosynthesis